MPGHRLSSAFLHLPSIAKNWDINKSGFRSWFHHLLGLCLFSYLLNKDNNKTNPHRIIVLIKGAGMDKVFKAVLSMWHVRISGNV